MNMNLTVINFQNTNIFINKVIIVRTGVFGICIIILFNDGHVLHRRSGTVSVRKQINMILNVNDRQKIPVDVNGLHFLELFKFE